MVHEQLRLDAQACARAMRFSPSLSDPSKPRGFEEIVQTSVDDYKSGKALMQHMGADRLIDPATTGMMLAIRRGLIEETAAATVSE